MMVTQLIQRRDRAGFKPASLLSVLIYGTCSSNYSVKYYTTMDKEESQYAFDNIFLPFAPYGTPTKTIGLPHQNYVMKQPLLLFVSLFQLYPLFLGNHIIVNISSRP